MMYYLIKVNNKKKYDIAQDGDYLSLDHTSSTTRHSRVGHGISWCLDTHNTHCVVVDDTAKIIRDDPLDRGGHEYAKEVLNPIGICRTISTQSNNLATKISIRSDNVLRIRKLTPQECFILMGFTKEDADRLSAAGISNTQLYKLAGNSIVVDVLSNIFGNLYEKNV